MNTLNRNFKSAVRLIGKAWLQKQYDEFFVEDSDEDSTYEVPGQEEQPPPIVKQYRMAEEDLTGETTEVIDLPDWRNESLEFLRLGKIFELVRSSPVISPTGNKLDGITIQQLYREKLRSHDFFKSSRYELEVAAFYKEIGHVPAFVKEDETEQKSPDLALIDFNDHVQIECKHCRKQSDDERVQSNRSNKLFENIRQNLPSRNNIAIIELDRTPTGDEVVNVGDHLPSEAEIQRSFRTVSSLPFGTINVLEIPHQEPIVHPVRGLESFEIMTSLYEDNLRPVIDGYLDINRDFDEFGNSVLLFESQPRGATLLARKINFIAIKDSTWGNNVFQRFKNQFSGTSGKFDDNPAVLHINFPSREEGNSLQELKLRKKGGGELKPRPEISGVFVSGLIHHPVFSDDLIERWRIHIPNYAPNHRLPDDFIPLQGMSEKGKSVDRLMKESVDEDLVQDPEGDRKAISQEEGSLSFRFKPNEARPTDESLYIVNILSLDEETRLELLVTANQELKLNRIDHDTGFWTCTLDVSDIPECDAMHIFITWSHDELGLYVGAPGEDILRSASAGRPEGGVSLQDGELHIDE